jgi:hypothetical protein
MESEWMNHCWRKERVSPFYADGHRRAGSASTIQFGLGGLDVLLTYENRAMNAKEVLAGLGGWHNRWSLLLRRCLNGFPAVGSLS